MTDDRSAFTEARDAGLQRRHETREARAAARNAVERSAAVYVLRQFEALMRNRIEGCKGETRHRAELDMAILDGLWEEARMNGYEGKRGETS